jgi:TPR repeat protein
VAADPVAALHWFRLAAEQGNPGAQLQLGLAYQLGLGTDKDILESNRWLEKAAEQGQPRAQLELAIVHRDGMGVPADPLESAMWMMLSAQGGSLAAKAILPSALRSLSAEKRAEVRARAAQWREAHHLPAAEQQPVRMEVEPLVRPPGVKGGAAQPGPGQGPGPAQPDQG